MNARYNQYYPLIFLLALLAWFINKAAGAPFSDFGGYYFGSQELLRGNYQHVYDTYSLNALIAQKGYPGVFVCYAPFPPFTSIVFAPFLLLPIAVAKIVFNIFSTAVFVFTLTRAIKFFSIPNWVTWLIPVLFFIPLRNNIFFGQAYLLLFVLLIEGYMAYKKGRMVLAALLWSVAIVFKLFPLVILFFLVVKKQYKQALYCLAGCMLLGIVSVLVNGFAVWQYYGFTIFPRATSGDLNAGYTFLFQSACMLLKNLFVYDAVQNPHAWFNSQAVFIISMVLYKAALLAGCVGITLNKKATDVIAFAGWVTASLLLSPNGSTYSLILLLFPLLALCNSKQIYLYVAMALLFFINTIPVQALANWPLLLKFPRLYLLLVLFLLLVIDAGVRFQPKPLIAFFIVLLLAEAPKLFAQKENSAYLLPNDLPLVYAYAIKDNRLVYYYWDEKGSNETVTGYAVQQYSTGDLEIKNNQLYFKGKQLTSTPDRKQQAMLVNGRHIIYLSDQNRGFGFYALRQLSLP